jgi:two-component system, NtrC family, sensor kinase
MPSGEQEKFFSNVVTESERRFRGLFEAVACGLVIHNAEGAIIDANDAACEYLGLTQGQIRGLTSIDPRWRAIHEDGSLFPGESHPAMVTLKTGKAVRDVVMGVFHPGQGEYRWFLVSSVPIFDNSNNLEMVVANFLDVTKRKKADEALEKSETLYRTLFDNSDDGFILLEPIYDENGKAFDFKFLKVNRAYERQTGTDAAVIEGKSAKEAAPDLEPQWISLISSVAKTGKAMHHENYNRHTRRWYDAYYFPYAESQVGILFRDITEHKKLEEATEESRKKYRDLIENNYDFIWEMDSSGRYTYCSPQMEKLWGLKPSEMIGKTPFDVMPPGEKEKALASFMLLGSSPEPFKGLQSIAYDGQGRLIFLEINGVPFFDDHGRLRGFRGISRDITERKNLERQLQDQERLAAIGATAGMVGHDIRNPLQSMIGEIYLLKSELTQMPENEIKNNVSESFEIIEKNILYINKIVSDLQDYARTLKPEFSLLDLSYVFAEVLKNTKIPDNIVLSTDFSGQLTLRSDPTFLQRMLTNLMTNAVQAMPEGGKLEVEVCRKGQKICITVSDTGVGIPEEVKSKIFSPMFTTKSKGQGLGLSVVKRLAEALGGSIRFESEEGKGTKFIIELPTG